MVQPELKPVLVNGKPIAYDKLPNQALRADLEEYFEYGRTPSPRDFTYELLTNDLMGCMTHGDETNLRLLREWCIWLYNRAPAGSFGTLHAVEQYAEARSNVVAEYFQAVADYNATRG